MRLMKVTSPIINLENSPTRLSPQESSTSEENRKLKVRMVKMFKAWSNRMEPPGSLSVFPEITPREKETTQVFV